MMAAHVKFSILSRLRLPNRSKYRGMALIIRILLFVPVLTEAGILEKMFTVLEVPRA